MISAVASAIISRRFARRAAPVAWPFPLPVGAPRAQPTRKPLVMQVAVMSWSTITAGHLSSPLKRLLKGRCAFTADNWNRVAPHARRTAAFAGAAHQVTTVGGVARARP